MHEEIAALDQEWEDRLNRLAIEASAADPPRRFTICDDNPDTNDEIVYAWGLAFPSKAIVFRPPSDTRVTASPERAMWLYARRTDVRLVWLDPEPRAAGA